MSILEDALEQGIVADAAVAASEGQARDFWCMRENISEVQKHEGGSIKHDVSVPVSAIPRFIDEADAALDRLVPGARPVPFGHYGDGNIHFNISQPKGADKDAYLARWEEVSDAVHGIVLRFGGSISAEHGIGRMKAAALETVKTPVRACLDAADQGRLRSARYPQSGESSARALECVRKSAKRFSGKPLFARPVEARERVAPQIVAVAAPSPRGCHRG